MMKANLRFNAYHSPKARLVGSRATHIPPAWKTANIPAAAQQAQQVNGRVNAVAGSVAGSLPGAGRVLISNLPVDVMLEEVVDLLRKTVGMTRESFMCHDEKGRPLGIAIIAFVNPAHAAAARTRYNRKVIDGRRELRIELVYDSDPPAPLAPRAAATMPVLPQRPRTLLDRISGAKPSAAQKGKAAAAAGPSRPSAITQTQPLKPSTKFAPQPASTPKAPAGPVAHMSSARQRSGRMKKGPRRVRKLVTAADLDQEMDDYNAQRET